MVLADFEVILLLNSYHLTNLFIFVLIFIVNCGGGILPTICLPDPDPL